MLAKVRENVDERVPHSAWGSESTAVEAVGPKRAASTKQIVHVARDADRDAPDAARERALVCGLDYEMNMIALHGVMDDAKVLGIAPCCAR